jgi:2-polyprenyl-6-methoxyphenol hydroxylase-like FAD-dependent oxidoreductase
MVWVHAHALGRRIANHLIVEWNKQATLEQVLHVYRDFDPAIKALMCKVDISTIRVWQLLDMEKLPTWTAGKMALLGDAAHPLTPRNALRHVEVFSVLRNVVDQGQGAAQAIEDAAALTVVLPRGTSPSEIPERLRLYEGIRYERAHKIQEFSRLAGKDWEHGRPGVDSKCNNPIPSTRPSS